MPFDRVAALFGALLFVASFCVPNWADEAGRTSANLGAAHPFALPNSLNAVQLPEPPLSLPTGNVTAFAGGSAVDVNVRAAVNSTVPSNRFAPTATKQTPIHLRLLPAPRHAAPVPDRQITIPTPQLQLNSPQDALRNQVTLGESRRRSSVTDASDFRQVIPNQVVYGQPSLGNVFPDQPGATVAGAADDASNRRLIQSRGASGRRMSRPSLINADRIRLVAEEQSVLVPLRAPQIDETVDLSDDHGLVTLIASGAELKSVLRMIADHHQLNLVLGPSVEGPVTVSIRGAKLEAVLDAILGVAGFAWHRVDNLLYVTSVDAQGMDPRVQGRTIQVYQLDYVAAADIQQVATGLLSPVGNAFISESDSADELRTRETLVVEDTPAAHRRIGNYISQVDVPPMQVLIEAHVLQISLGHEEQHGIDLQALLRMNGSVIALDGVGFTDLAGSESDLAIRFNGTDLEGVIQLIRRCTNSRTLASPKVSVVNRQEARIQIGQRLPYAVATTTQTTTVESVEFLEVGIVLTVRPVITEDGNVLMEVFPKVSGGKITQNGYPEEETTEVQTTIMLPDGGGIVIGGLIREEEVQARAVVPYFSKVPVLGHLFKRRSDETRRNELVVALVARVIHDGQGPRLKEVMDLEDALPDYAASDLMQR